MASIRESATPHACLVIGVKRRSPVGKALLSSVSQGLLLEAPVPVLAINIDDPRR